MGTINDKKNRKNRERIINNEGEFQQIMKKENN